MTNHFESTIQDVQQASPPQRVDALIDSVCKQMQAQSGDLTPLELSKELMAKKPEIVRAFNQRQQGG